MRIVGIAITLAILAVGCGSGGDVIADDSPSLVAACLKGDLGAVTLAVDDGANVNEATMAGTPLQISAREGHVGIVRFLLKSGADPDDNPGLFVGRTPLQEAIMKNHYEVVVALVEGGADVNKKNTNGRTPLDFAALALDDPTIAEFLLQHRAQFSRPENNAALKALGGDVRELRRRVTQ